MITKEFLLALKIGEYIEETRTNTLAEFIYINNNYLFKTLYSLAYPVGEIWSINCYDLNRFNIEFEFIKCSENRMQYYNKLMVFE